MPAAEPMTQEIINRLRELLAKATPGEWHATNHFADPSTPCNCAYVLSEGYAGSICQVSIDNGKNIADGGNDSPPRDEAAANASLIAEMKNALPALLSTLTNLTPSGVERIDLDGATPNQMQRANDAVEANLVDGAPKYDSAQGYACALTAIMQTDALALPSEPPSVIHWSGTEDEQHRERMKACRARRAQWGEDDCEEKDGSCSECTTDMAEALRVPPPQVGTQLPETGTKVSPSQGDVEAPCPPHCCCCGPGEPCCDCGEIVSDPSQGDVDGRAACERPEVAAMRFIEQLRAEEGDSVTIFCDDPEPDATEKRLAIECNGAWTEWKDRRFHGESVLQCLAKAVVARKALASKQDGRS